MKRVRHAPPSIYGARVCTVSKSNQHLFRAQTPNCAAQRCLPARKRAQKASVGALLFCESNQSVSIPCRLALLGHIRRARALDLNANACVDSMTMRVTVTSWLISSAIRRTSIRWRCIRSIYTCLTRWLRIAGQRRNSAAQQLLTRSLQIQSRYIPLTLDMIDMLLH